MATAEGPVILLMTCAACGELIQQGEFHHCPWFRRDEVTVETICREAAKRGEPDQ